LRRQGVAAFLEQIQDELVRDDEAFDEMILLFKATLEDSQIADTDVEAIIADLNTRRVYIVRSRAKRI